jgi:NADPH-dependent ferric siderophore reductase
MGRVTLGGPELDGLRVEQPAASVRVLIPAVSDRELVIPEWTGNEFLLPGGGRPGIRTLTPRRVDPARLELDVDIVIHGRGRASEWAQAARPGDPAAVSGPARGYDIDPDSPGFLLGGDETAIPAIGQLLEQLPPDKPVRALLEIAHASARLDWPALAQKVEWLPQPAGVTPGQALVEAVIGADLARGIRVWVAGEAAAVQRIRRHLFETVQFPRAHATVRGYWKHGRANDT